MIIHHPPDAKQNTYVLLSNADECTMSQGYPSREQEKKRKEKKRKKCTRTAHPNTSRVSNASRFFPCSNPKVDFFI